MSNPIVGGCNTSNSSGSGSLRKARDDRDDKPGLPSRVANVYYKHGLFLSSYPTCSISLAIAVIIFCCYPLMNIPLPGTIPTKIILPYNEDTINIDSNTVTTSPITPATTNISNLFNFNPNNILSLYNLSLEPSYLWTRIEPMIYVQQIILRSMVIPWNQDLQLIDAYRSPLYEVFKLLELVRNHENEKTKMTLNHLCLHVENIKRSTKENIFPEYNCLILSPANLWQQNIQTFNQDRDLLNTIFHHHNLQKSKVSTAEMLFGMVIRDTGLKRYPMRVRSRIVQYALTIVLRENNPEFINSLREKLIKQYPLYQDVSPEKSNNKKSTKSIMYIYYPGEFNWIEFVPLCGAFVILFLYVYFSVRKIDVIRSRLILATSAVITVLGSLLMSLGLCFFFGLTISMQSKGIYPYLVILVGLENVLILTKSVITTDNNLDIKIRIAQGLSKEGWSITKNLLTEITILTVGLATLVPVIQEFCIFAIVGLISDFFLQMLFFSTVLGFDIKRVEYSAEVRHLPKSLLDQQQNFSNSIRNNNSFFKYRTMNDTLIRSRSHPKLSALDHHHHQYQHVKKNSLTGGVGSGSGGVDPQSKKIPKRLRIVNFWARTRFFQRGFMIWMVLWISNIIYNSGLIEEIFVIDKNHSYRTSSSVSLSDSSAASTNNIENTNENFNFMPNDGQQNRKLNNDDELNHIKFNSNQEKLPHESKNSKNNKNTDSQSSPPESNNQETVEEKPLNITEQLNKLKYSDYETIYQLSNWHWASILKQYNISVSGRYVTILPAIKLSHPVSPETAINLRNSEEKSPQHFQWKTLAVALDPLDFSDVDETNELPAFNFVGKTPLYPKTPMEILLTTILISVSVFVIAYTFVVLYRCVCSKNYAEWRASWNSENEKPNEPKMEQHILEGFPIQVNGHKHRVECCVTDGNMIASSCLQGQVRVWDVTNGELVTEIDRLKYFEMQMIEVSVNARKNSEGGQSPVYINSPDGSSQFEVFPAATKTSPILTTKSPKNFVSKLKNKINFNFSSQQQQQQLQNDPKLYDFNAQYQKYFSTSNPQMNSLFSSSDKIIESDCRNRFFKHQQPQSMVRRTNSNDDDYKSLQQYQQLQHSNDSLQTGCVDNRKIYNMSPIWCIDFLDNLIVIGCADGRLEFWEGTTGNFKCIYESESTHNNGVTNIKLAGDKVVVARLSGRVDFLKLETYTQGRHIDWSFTSAYRRTHIRTGSAGSLGFLNQSTSPTTTTPQTTNSSNTAQTAAATAPTTVEELRCILEYQQQGHQQPITCLDIVGCNVMTGSQDHTLKVFRLENYQLLYTLHGHCGPITCLFIDQWQSGTGGSGSQDGLLCVWDLITGACMYKIQAHDDSIVSLVCSPSYVISLGLDERLRIWERFQGHLLNTINVMHAYSTLLMLTPSLLVTGKPGALIVWDLRTGEPVREVKLDCSNSQLCPKIMLRACGSVICDYGSQMRIVRFPLVAADKCE
uniref:Sterol regulatory element-binding protein cleavage-activating protein n=1 Tax=Corethrella appendiculata TaxID=1370023 RepID=W4VSE5_9DIPT